MRVCEQDLSGFLSQRNQICAGVSSGNLSLNLKSYLMPLEKSSKPLDPNKYNAVRCQPFVTAEAARQFAQKGMSLNLSRDKTIALLVEAAAHVPEERFFMLLGELQKERFRKDSIQH